jgi:hypothetical protein
MKHKLTFKTPDVIDQIADRIKHDDSIPDDEKEDCIKEEQKKLEQWLIYGENIVVHFDTDIMVATVLKA